MGIIEPANNVIELSRKMCKFPTETTQKESIPSTIERAKNNRMDRNTLTEKKATFTRGMEKAALEIISITR